MSARPFRFGVVAAPRDGDQWRSTVRRVSDLGYTTLLMPDGLQLLAPAPALAMAAALSTLRVGTFVYASPLRPPRLAAWEAHSLSVLTGGRFELGIGTGRPAARAMAEELGLPFGTGAERLAQVAELIEHVRRLDGDMHTPVLIAAGGPRARALAAAQADIVAVAAGPLAPREEIARMVADVRDQAGERADGIEFSSNIFVVGEQVPPWVQSFIGADAATLIAHNSLTMLRGTPTEMADELQRRRESLGISYVSVNEIFLEEFAPVVERLTGR